MRTPEEILQNWYPNYKKRIAFDENVIEAIKQAQKEAYKEALTNLVSECVKLGTHYDIVQITDICYKLNNIVSSAD